MNDIQTVTVDNVARLKAALAVGALDQVMAIWRSTSAMLDGAATRELAVSLTAAGYPKEADEVLAAGVENHPHDFSLLREYAEHARRCGRMTDALSRYGTVNDRFPHEPLGLTGQGQILAHLGDLVSAEHALAAANKLGPDRFWPALTYIQILRRRGKARQGLARARDLVGKFFNEPLAHAEYIESLRAAGMHESCAEAARVAAAKFPDNQRIADLLATAEASGSGLTTRDDVHTVSLSTYGTPRELVLTPTKLRRVLVVGACLTSGISKMLAIAEPACASDFVLLNNLWQLPTEPPLPAADYDFMLVQLPLRSALPEGAYFRIPHTVEAYQQAFEQACESMRHQLKAAMRWNEGHGILTFVWNFPVPQQNPMGRLLPRYDLRNMVFFIEKLNEVLAAEVAHYNNAYLFDLDQVLSTHGKWFFQDDSILQLNHGAMIAENHAERDLPRLEKLRPIGHTYPINAYRAFDAIWAEIVGMYRTIRQIDMVKLVIMDIDDTLWRGVAAENTEHSPASIEGWPLGVIEALNFLKRRGVLIALVSKNEEALIKKLWPRIIPGRLSLSDFVTRKINWRPKVENIAEILSEVNFLPRSVLFIDDNPVERAAVQAAFPDIRTFGSNPYVWRRLLLWAPEVQVATITTESAVRTEMVQAQIEREIHRATLSRDDFLRGQNLTVKINLITRTDQEGFKRSLELINKTNQFNTTGRRWTQAEFVELFARGGLMLASSVSDRFTSYGIVGVLVLDADRIAQFVMSCRVIGMDVEIAIVAEALSILANQRFTRIRADFVTTDANLLCRELWHQCGFEQAGDIWWRSLAQPLAWPPHVSLICEEAC